MTSAFDDLSPQQQALVDQWLPSAIVEKNHSWGLVSTTVLEVTHAGSRFIVKAGGEDDHHLQRELHAHHHWLEPWTSRGRAPTLVHASADAKLLVTRYLPGDLVLGSAHADEPSTYRQAGDLLALLHAQTVVTDDDYERRENEKSLGWLGQPHRIAATTVQRLQAEIAAWPTPPATLVPTHGDWQPRNWLSCDDVVSVIDFGRAAMRPAFTDFARLAAQDFRRDPKLEAAFLDGYGTDPREKAAWYRNRVREAIGTTAWAYRVGDEPFEDQGHRMIAEAFSSKSR
ncbi:phosphotransferase [Actinoplanes sp. Pm04-4]|uniref:Phosphotransferase n=1 Tax=Paractinoplanes pyxinae TaxID=2997416 RepID=A0ABT4B4M8_9ACTN|nr:phosphotransferase [Actinoplanes pyxinae]MCY1141425.1 phosphotransferase [Actinoplanes pyxinae]